MTILELLDNINNSLEEIKNNYNLLNTDIRNKLDTAIADLNKLINKNNLSEEDVKKIIIDIAPDLSVKNANLFNNLTLEQLKLELIPTYDIMDFKLIENGARIRYSFDPIDGEASQNGYILFCPHNKEEYELARKYLLSLGKPKAMGPLGIYYDGINIPGRWCHKCWFSNIPLNSNGLGRHGWKVVDGSPVWWASDRTDVTEPNGDYTRYAFLGIQYDNNGFVKWYNDAHSSYSYTTYLTVKRRSVNGN
jgi:hypothetical protein